MHVCTQSHSFQGFSHSKRYIATQGPNERTVIDFWRLVWQEGVSVIVMLTNVIEGGKVKCEHCFSDSHAH